MCRDSAGKPVTKEPKHLLIEVYDANGSQVESRRIHAPSPLPFLNAPWPLLLQDGAFFNVGIEVICLLLPTDGRVEIGLA